MRTVAQHISMMRHALGKSPAAGHDLYDTFTDAGRQLLSLREWSWSKRGPEESQLRFKADQAYVELPADFGRVVSVYTTDGGGVRLVASQEISLLRSGGVTGDPVAVCLCFDAARRQKNPGGGSILVADVWPTPTADDSPTVRMVYRASFKQTTSADDDTCPDIHPDADLLLSMLAQELACVQENKRRLFEPTIITDEIARVAALDGSRQWQAGQMSGGALDRLPPTNSDAVPISSITVT